MVRRIRKPLKYFIDLWIIEDLMIGVGAFDASPIKFQELPIREDRVNGDFPANPKN
jgi:hypothetical protein